MKIITICGSLRFKDEILDIAMKMELAGNCVLCPIIPVGDKDAYSENDLEMLAKMHKEKIHLSDAILVVNVNNYIGDTTKDEIEYAKSLGKSIMYYSDMID